MSYHIQITKSAKKDLKNIGEFHISKYGVDQARKVIKETPSISPLSLPIANERTSKNKSDETSGEKIVCIQTFKNLRVSF